jgi:hypothetical protein
MSAALESLFNTEEDERLELENALAGVDHHSPAEVDAFASELLGSLGRCEADLQRYAEAENAELARIRTKYEDARNSALARGIASLRSRRDMLEGAIKALAEQQDFGAKKSRETANGTYGRRTKPAHLEIVDQAKLLEWADGNPALVTVEKSVKQKAVNWWYGETGEIPPGTDFHAPQEIAFARPEKA